VDGLLYVDKPAGITSHDVVAVVRRAARSKRVGHAGTLDPFATGLLVLGVGQCTRLLPYIVGEPKVYEAVIRFGAETNTDDSTGDVTLQREPPDLASAMGSDALRVAIYTLTGSLMQAPPAFSAKHVNGTRAYALARQGIEVMLAPSPVHVSRWDVLERSDDMLSHELKVRVTCGAGTYIRALARDLGRALHSAAHCATLRRVSSGPASVTDAVSLDRLHPASIADGDVTLRSPLPALGDIATESLDEASIVALSHGRAINATNPGPRVAFVHAGFDSHAPEDARVIGIGIRTTGERWQPKVVLLGPGS